MYCSNVCEKYFIYIFPCLWNILSMKCPIYEIAYIWNVFQWNVFLWNALFLFSSSCEILNFYGCMYGTYYGFQTLGGVSEKGCEEKKRRTLWNMGLKSSVRRRKQERFKFLWRKGKHHSFLIISLFSSV